jgi:hypothetical protein
MIARTLSDLTPEKVLFAILFIAGIALAAIAEL